MKYCQVSVTAEPSIIGVKNGVYQVEIDEKLLEKNQNYFDFENHFSGYNREFWNNQNKIYELNPPKIISRLLKKAKVTDIMGYAQEYQFLNNVYSQKYIDIIKTFTIGKYRTFDFEIEGVPVNYYLLFVEALKHDEIKFEKSILVTGRSILNNLKYYTINTKEEYIQFKLENPTGRFEKIAISKEYIDRDIISIQGTADYFYSEKLIDFLLDCDITGLEVSYNNSIQLEFV